MLTTRLSIAMVGLVALTAIALGYTSYHYLESATLPGEIKRLSGHAESLAAELDLGVRAVCADTLAIRGSASMNGVIRARLAGGVDPGTNLTEAEWRTQFAGRLTGDMQANPHFLQTQLIGLADGGREIVRVERTHLGEIRVAADAELAPHGAEPGFRAAAALPNGALYISPILRERAAGADTALPVLYVATPVAGADGAPFGVFVIQVDMRLAFAPLRPLHENDGAIYLLDGDGAFLNVGGESALHARGSAAHVARNGIAGLARRAASEGPVYQRLTTAASNPLIVAACPIRLGDGPRVVAVETVPEEVLLAPAAAIRTASVRAGLVAAVGALVLALVIARSFCKPLVRMTAAVERFAQDETVDVPTAAAGEVGQLARSFANMAREVREKNAALRAEVEERRRAETELARHTVRERTFVAVVESAQDAIIAVTLDGTITAWNPAAERLFGYLAAEAIGRDSGIIVPENHSDEPLAILDRARRGEQVEQLETVRVARDGRPINVTLSASPLRSPAQGVIGVSMIIHDITARTQAEQRFRLALESSPSGIIILDRAGDIQLVNAAAEAMFGYTREDLIGMPMDRLLPPAPTGAAQPPARTDWTARLLPLQEAQDLHALRRDGSEFPIELGLNPFDAPGGPQVLCTIVDITERKRDERERERLAARVRQSEKMEAIGQLAGGIAHDFNNILTAVLGNTELVAAELGASPPNGSAIREHLAQIEQSATWAAELTRQLLAFGSRQVSQPRPLNLNDCLAGMEKMLRRLIQEDIALRFAPAPQLPSVMADASQIEQILVNLVVNARDAMPEGGILCVETKAVTLDEHSILGDSECQPGEYVVLIVSDTGTGMDKSTLAHIFEPFFTTKPMGHGTGLGLATVYGIVRQSGGQVHVYSEPQRGSTFRIYLPAIGAPTAAHPGSTPAAAPGGAGNILLCEDDESVRQLMERILAGAGYTVHSAGHGEEALHLAGSLATPIDLLVTDVVMPGMHGRALAERLRAQRPDLPVLYVSGYTSNVIAHHGLLESDIELIEKPFTRNALLQRVHDLLAAPSARLAPAGAS